MDISGQADNRSTRTTAVAVSTAIAICLVLVGVVIAVRPFIAKAWKRRFGNKNCSERPTNQLQRQHITTSTFSATSTSNMSQSQRQKGHRDDLLGFVNTSNPLASAPTAHALDRSYSHGLI
jgi:hypothetical protein